MTDIAHLLTGRPLGFDIGWLNPLSWLGNKVTEVAAAGWTAVMIAIWSGGVWLLKTAFAIIDAFTNPDLSENGPLRAVYPVTFGIGLVVVGILIVVQIGYAAWRRDGESVARVAIGIVQFGAVWLGYVAVAAALVVGAHGLTTGLLQSLLHVDVFGDIDIAAGWGKQVGDTTVATVLGVTSLLLVFPAAFLYILFMLVRAAALIVLAATSPISAAGLPSELGRAWFWKTNRWFFAALLSAPLAALILGIGLTVTQGALSSTGGHNKDAALVGAAVVGAILAMVGAVCPVVLFKLLAFVDPNTSSGAAMRASLAASGGLGLLTGRGTSTAGNGAAADGDGTGRSGGEASSDAITSSRFLAATGAAQRVAVGTAAAGTIGADLADGMGVGHPSGYYNPGPYRRGSQRYGTRRGDPPPEATSGEDPAESPPHDPPQPPSPTPDPTHPGEPNEPPAVTHSRPGRPGRAGGVPAAGAGGATGGAGAPPPA